MTDVTLRTATPDEAVPFRRAMGDVFAFEPRDETNDDFKQWLEWDRSIAAFDGDEIVATGGAVTYRMVVPGGAQVGAGGLTVITVKPTHRRRGLLTRMIERHFEDCRGRGEEISILWASESSIYGRFGYGVAVEMRDMKIDKVHGRLRADIPEPQGTIRMLDVEAATPVVPKVQQASTVGRGVPGAIVTRDQDWASSMNDFEHQREGSSRLHFAVYERDGEPRGYARYRLKSDWDDTGPKGTLKLHQVHAVDGEAYAALWRYIFSIDLMTVVEANNRPPHDPLYHLLADPRRVHARGFDAIWVRILDVPAALSARAYQVPGSLVIDVRDDFLPDAGGRFRLDGGPDGASCVPTDASADLTLTTEHLSAAYLGAPRLGALGWLRLIGGEPEAVSLADAMFQWPQGPETFVHF